MTKPTAKPETIKSEEKQPAAACKATVKGEDATIDAPFEVKEYHKKALSKMLFCHHHNQELTYKELSAEIGVGEKTKAWQCEAWKDLKSNAYIVPASGKGKLKLSDKGVALATSFASDDELEDYKTPQTNEDHHEKIKSKLMKQEKAKKMGPQIFDLLVQSVDKPMTKHELAAEFNTLADSHGFFYGFQGTCTFVMCSALLTSFPKGPCFLLSPQL